MTERDRGTTLVETVVTLLLLGLVAVVMGFAITTVLRVTPTTEARVDDARSLQGLTSQWPSDIASTPAQASNIRPSPSGLTCDGSETATGSNLLEVTWTDVEASPVAIVAAYRLESRPSGHVVRRYSCSDESGPFDDTVTATLTGPLANVAVVTASAPYDVVALDLQTLEGDPIRIEATPRNPLDALPTTTTAPTLPPPTPCAVSFVGAPYGPVGRHTSVELDEELLAAVPIEMTLSGATCGVLTIEYDTGPSDPPDPPYEAKSRIVAVVGTTGNVTIPAGDTTADTPHWAPGTHVIEVYNNGAPLATPATTTLEVSP